MTAAFGQLVRWELVLQVRQHVLTSNAASAALLALLASLLPDTARTPAVVSALVFLDPALVGLAFVGGVVLMERGAGAHRALAVTPLTASAYLLSKVSTLTLGGTVAGMFVAVAARGADAHWGLLVLALLLSNALAVLLGFVVAARSRSMNGFLVRTAALSLVLYLPLLGHFELLPGELAATLWLVPTAPMLLLLRCAFEASPSTFTVGGALGGLLLWGAAAWLVARRDAREEVLTDAG